MKTLIQQVLLGQGHLAHRRENYDTVFLKDIAIPSVKRYAEKYGYDYKLIDGELTPSLLMLPQNIIFDRMPMAFEKYMHLDTGYDNILLLDSDVFVAEYAPALPITTGVFGSEPAWDIDRRLLNWKNRRILFNAGFILFEKNVAKSFGTYVKTRVENWQSFEKFANGHYQDEEILSEFLDEHIYVPFEYIGNNWNYTGVDWHNHIPEKYMYHFAGPRKHSRYRRLS